MKPTIEFITNFYFSSNMAYTKMPFFKNPNFDPAYLQQQCDKVYEKMQYDIKKTKRYWNKTEQKELARMVKLIYA